MRYDRRAYTETALDWLSRHPPSPFFPRRRRLLSFHLPPIRSPLSAHPARRPLAPHRAVHARGPPTVKAEHTHMATPPAAADEPNPPDLVAKVQLQARRLVEQQRELVSVIDYARRCEQRLRQLDPTHPLPVTAEHLELPVQRAVHALPTPWAPPEGEAPPRPAQPTLPSRPSGAPAATDARRTAVAAAAVSAAGGGASRRVQGARGESRGRPEGAKVATLESLRVERSKLQAVLASEREASAKFRAEKEREVALLRRTLEAHAQAKGLATQGAALLLELEETRARAAELQVAEQSPLRPPQPAVARAFLSPLPASLLCQASLDSSSKIQTETAAELAALRGRLDEEMGARARSERTVASLREETGHLQQQGALSRQAHDRATAHTAALQARAGWCPSPRSPRADASSAGQALFAEEAATADGALCALHEERTQLLDALASERQRAESAKAAAEAGRRENEALRREAAEARAVASEQARHAAAAAVQARAPPWGGMSPRASPTSSPPRVCVRSSSERDAAVHERAMASAERERLSKDLRTSAARVEAAEADVGELRAQAAARDEEASEWRRQLHESEAAGKRAVDEAVHRTRQKHEEGARHLAARRNVEAELLATELRASEAVNKETGDATRRATRRALAAEEEARLSLAAAEEHQRNAERASRAAPLSSGGARGPRPSGSRGGGGGGAAT
ncbi:hypothetical protein AB1Y20_006667 [Prymnesium parvum]|uniref:Uncharacterized protein n=1 Tax=Prymnesium parvum TaxID=97485 RepID=A0AB34J0X9_PRYPA